MNTIPPYIYEHVAELAADITNATLAADDALAESLYQRLQLYHEEQLAAGRSADCARKADRLLQEGAG